jgi:cytochrome c
LPGELSPSTPSRAARYWRTLRASDTMRAAFPLKNGVKMKTVAVAFAAAGLLATGVVQADAGEDLLKKSGCTACHSKDKKLVGPAYVEVAAKYKGDGGAAAKLADKVKKGGSGIWGPVPMPPNTQVKDDDVKTMIAYILALKK